MILSLDILSVKLLWEECYEYKFIGEETSPKSDLIIHPSDIFLPPYHVPKLLMALQCETIYLREEAARWCCFLIRKEKGSGSRKSNTITWTPGNKRQLSMVWKIIAYTLSLGVRNGSILKIQWLNFPHEFIKLIAIEFFWSLYMFTIYLYLPLHWCYIQHDLTKFYFTLIEE